MAFTTCFSSLSSCLSNTSCQEERDFVNCCVNCEIYRVAGERRITYMGFALFFYYPMWWDIGLHQRLSILCFSPCCFLFYHPFTLMYYFSPLKPSIHLYCFIWYCCFAPFSIIFFVYSDWAGNGKEHFLSKHNLYLIFWFGELLFPHYNILCVPLHVHWAINHYIFILLKHENMVQLIRAFFRSLFAQNLLEFSFPSGWLRIRHWSAILLTIL